MSSHSHDEKSHGHAHGPGCDHGCEHGHDHSGCEHGHDEKKTEMDSLKTSLESSSNLEQKVHMLRAEACLAARGTRPLPAPSAVVPRDQPRAAAMLFL